MGRGKESEHQPFPYESCLGAQRMGPGTDLGWGAAPGGVAGSSAKDSSETRAVRTL